MQFSRKCFKRPTFDCYCLGGSRRRCDRALGSTYVRVRVIFASQTACAERTVYLPLLKVGALRAPFGSSRHNHRVSRRGGARWPRHARPPPSSPELDRVRGQQYRGRYRGGCAARAKGKRAKLKAMSSPQVQSICGVISILRRLHQLGRKERERNRHIDLANACPRQVADRIHPSPNAGADRAGQGPERDLR